MAYTPRLSSDGMAGNPWWYSDSNPFYLSDYGLPNCTCYAYGRYAEIRNSFARLPTGNAGDWFDRAKSAFPVSDKPELGAVACWKAKAGTNYSGHVGIVEQINADGSFVTSNSAWRGTYFFLYNCYGDNFQGGGWMKSRGYQFQGFILQTSAEESLPEGNWSAKNSGGYARTSGQAKGNAVKIFRWLKSNYNWSLSAICGLLGNIEAECSYNFWLWENGILRSDSNLQYEDYPGQIEKTGHGATKNGYGFVQWTPSAQYTKTAEYMSREGFGVNYSDSPGKLTDAEVQLYAIVEQKEGNQWIRDKGQAKKYGYNWTWSEYQHSQASPENCAFAFMVEYERPYIGDNNDGSKIESSAHLSRRKEAARYWYNYFSGFRLTEDEPRGGIITDPPADDSFPDIPTSPEGVEPDPFEPPLNPVNSGTNAHVKYIAQWYAQKKGFYGRETVESLNNARCMFNILYFECKWSVSSICALLGCVEISSGYNPWYWNGDNVQPSFILEGDILTGWAQTENPELLTENCAYGLLQFCPPSGYFDNGRDYNDFAPDFANPEYEIRTITIAGETLYLVIYTGYTYTGVPSDGDAQTRYINDIVRDADGDFPDLYTTDFEYLIKRLIEKGVIHDLTPDELAQAVDAAFFWFHQFHGRKYNMVIYSNRRRINYM